MRQCTRSSQKKMRKFLVSMWNLAPIQKHLDGTNAPTNEELGSLEFQDVNTALANRVEAIENATSKGYNKVDFEKLVEKVVIQ